MKSRVRCALVFLLFILGTLSVAAQSAQVSGRVVDDSGAVVPDVKIIIKNLGSGLARDTVTNASGYYTIPQLQPGNRWNR